MTPTLAPMPYGLQGLAPYMFEVDTAFLSLAETHRPDRGGMRPAVHPAAHPATAWEVSPAAQDTPRPGVGQRFTIRFSLDEYYMLRAEQTVANTAPGAVVVRLVRVHHLASRAAEDDTFNAHSGTIGHCGGEVNFDWSCGGVSEAGTISATGRTGWIGLTDIYWLAALVPQPGASFDAAGHSQSWSSACSLGRQRGPIAGATCTGAVIQRFNGRTLKSVA
jgi:hypothetical protein